MAWERVAILTFLPALAWERFAQLPVDTELNNTQLSIELLSLLM